MSECEKDFDPARVLTVFFDDMKHYQRTLDLVIKRTGLEKPAVFMCTTVDLCNYRKVYALAAMPESEIERFEIRCAGQQIKRIQ